MGKKAKLNLSSKECAQLMSIVARGENWRERERAKTLLLLNDGLSMGEAAVEMSIHVRTVGLTRIDWLARRFESLVDRPRIGAPRKITPEQLEKIVNNANTQPLTAKGLLARHLEDKGVAVHVNTVTNALKEAGFVWKRTRHSLKKKR